MVMDLTRATFMGSFRSSTVRTGRVAIVGPTIFSIPGTGAFLPVTVAP